MRGHWAGIDATHQFPTWTPRGEFNYDLAASERGYAQWLTGRKLAAAAVARQVGLPLGHEVEVWLLAGIRLRGTLRLQEEMLVIEEDRLRHLELIVDNVSFTYREVESCLRLH